MKAVSPLIFSLALTAGHAVSIDEMTLEEKVGQLFTVCFKGKDVSEDVKTLTQTVGVGGIIYYTWAQELDAISGLEVQELSNSLQKSAKIPLFIFADQEGGIVNRLQGEDFTIFPGNKALAMTQDPLLAKESAYAIGKEIRFVGVNANLAPVVDVNNNPRNPIIGIRSFGEDADTVVAFAAEALQGYQEAKVVTCLKHFPGHGDVEIDSHEALPILAKSKRELDEVELVPFKKLASQTDMVMTAHLMVPSIDPVHCATTSKPILDILRKEIGFDGVIIADSLTMEGVLQNEGSLENAAIQALNAGCDILLFGGKKLVGTVQNKEITVEEVLSVYKAILQAIEKGQISKDRVDEAVRRILTLKNKRLVQDLTKDKPSIDSHRALAKKIASLALKTTINNFLPITFDKLVIIAPEIVKSTLQGLPLEITSKKVETVFFTGLAPTAEERKKACGAAGEADVVFFFSYNAWKNQQQAELIEVLSALNKPTTLIVLRDSLDETLYPNANTVLKTFGPTAPSLEAVSQFIKDFCR
jgi:beta-N-acetylhexosaminidase